MRVRQRLIDGKIPFRLARDLAPKHSPGDDVAIAAALYELLPDSAQRAPSGGWQLAGRLEGISRHPKYGQKHRPR